MKKYVLSHMLEDGFSEKYAVNYLNKIAFETGADLYPKKILEDAYARGFWGENFTYYNSTSAWKGEPHDFLSDYDYERLWPLNDWMRIWVNDKLTLKYMLAGTEFEDVLPEYYFYMSRNGLRALLDQSSHEQGFTAFLELLKKKRAFACKPNNGTLAAGFFKLSYDGHFWIENERTTEEGIIDFVSHHPNYIYTEFIYPEQSLAKISGKVPTIRIVMLNQHGNDPYIVPSSYIRFGTSAQGSANYVDGKQEGEYTISAGVNTVTGEFGNAHAFYLNRIIPIKEHPDTHVAIEGKIPSWEHMREKLLGISKFFFGVEWSGFDACVDSKGAVKIMEINSHPGIGFIQTFYPLLKDQKVEKYMRGKIKMLNNLSEDQRKTKNQIIR